MSTTAPSALSARDFCNEIKSIAEEFGMSELTQAIEILYATCERDMPRQVGLVVPTKAEIQKARQETALPKTPQEAQIVLYSLLGTFGANALLVDQFQPDNKLATCLADLAAQIIIVVSTLYGVKPEAFASDVANIILETVPVDVIKTHLNMH